MKYKLEKGKQARQGDIFLLPVKSINGSKQKRENGRIILALGESHTHCHVIEEPQVDLFVAGARKFLEVCFKKEVVLKVSSTQEKSSAFPRHFPIVLPQEQYEIRIQKQWDYMKQLAQRVID